jgi:hypothetical protein
MWAAWKGKRLAKKQEASVLESLPPFRLQAAEFIQTDSKEVLKTVPFKKPCNEHIR